MICTYKISLPDGVEMDDISTITHEAIREYYDAIHDKYGSFCDDCKNFNFDSGVCKKGYKTRTYLMEMGGYETSTHRSPKGCKDFQEDTERFEMEDQESIARSVRGSLDSFNQQYCH